MRGFAGVAFAMLSLAAHAEITAPPAQCEIANITRVEKLRPALGARAVEFVELAIRSSNDARLTSLVAPDAIFILAHNDFIQQWVGRVESARAFAKEIRANRFVFEDTEWGPPVVQACEKQKISVEFFDDAKRTRTEVEFEFLNGQVVKATGRQQTFRTGTIGYK